MKSTKLLLALFANFIITSMLLTASGGATTEEAAPKTEGVQVGIDLPTKNQPRWIQDEARFE